jgi:hypothetical protein
VVTHAADAGPPTGWRAFPFPLLPEGRRTDVDDLRAIIRIAGTGHQPHKIGDLWTAGDQGITSVLALSSAEGQLLTAAVEESAPRVAICRGVPARSRERPRSAPEADMVRGRWLGTVLGEDAGFMAGGSSRLIARIFSTYST